MIDSVKLNLLVLVNVCDQITRDQSGDQFGVLLGNERDGNLVVSTSFDIIVKNGILDQDFLFTRYGQFKTVLPNYKIVGVYHVTSSIVDLTLSIRDQLNNFFDNYSIHHNDLVMIFDKNLISNNKINASSYCKIQPIKTTFISNESERISTLTTVNHPNYSDESAKQDISLDHHQKNLSQAITQLHDRFNTILNWINSDKNVDLKKKIQINNQITFLASKLNPLKNSSTNTFLQLQTSQLSFLTEQLSSLENLKSEIKKNILRYTVSNFQNISNHSTSSNLTSI